MEDKYKLPSAEQFDKLNASLVEMGNIIAKTNSINNTNSWSELAFMVRLGRANQLFDYGDQIEEDWIDVDNNKAYSNAWDVAKFDDSVESEDDSTFKRSEEHTSELQSLS